MDEVLGKLIIDERAKDDPLTLRVRGILSRLPVETVKNAHELLRGNRCGNGSLILMHNRGAFVKDFPVPPDSPPCGEKYVITMLGCPYSCTYFYLQSYLKHRCIVIFTNTNRMREEIEEVLSADRPLRLTTGELGDSLALDHITETTADLLPLFAGTETLIEVRTKSAQIDHLLKAPGRGSHPSARNETHDTGVEKPSPKAPGNNDNLLVTWTLGPAEAIGGEEPGTATLDERLSALGRTLKAGIKVAIRLDPIIPHYADPSGYSRLIQRIASAAGEGRIYRFELGCLRFTPDLQNRIRARNPRSRLLRGEYLKDGEGKIRLYRPERVRLYREISQCIHSTFPDVPIDLSMEPSSVWEDAGLESTTPCKEPPPRAAIYALHASLPP
jgi:spore photoproduct lyase